MSTREPDRDRSIDEMLRRTAPRGAVTGDPSGRCLDAETLAEWIDGDLTAAEISAAEAHVSSCARCQAMVAAIVRTTPSTAVVVPWWRRGWAIGALVPLTAGATAVAIWIATPDAPQPPAPAVAVRETPATRGGPPPQPAQPEPEQSRQSAATVLRPPAPSQPEARILQPVAPPETADLRAKADAARREASDDEAKKEQLNAARRDGSTAAAVVPPAAPAPPPSAAAPAAAERGAATGFRDAAAIAPQRENALARSATLAKSAFVQPPTEIVAPDRSVRWRSGAAGMIQRSTDGGATWTALSSGVTEDLTAGSAPSSTACWIVGRRGTVLVTADGGQWRRATAPVSIDLVAVQATDLATATVTAADGRRFRTADGGQTWTPGGPFPPQR